MRPIINRIINSNFRGEIDSNSYTKGVTADFYLSSYSIIERERIDLINTSQGLITSYEWYENNVLFATTKDAIWYPMVAGERELKLRVSGGGYHDTKIINVFVVGIDKIYIQIGTDDTYMAGDDAVLGGFIDE